MIKLGDMVEVTKYGKATHMWLVKQPSLKKYTDKIYVVLARSETSGGWWTANNGTLADMRDFVKQSI